MHCDNRDDWIVKVGGELMQRNVTETSYTYIQFAYTHSAKKVEIRSTWAVPEYSSLIILSSLITASLLSILVFRRKRYL